MAHNPLSEERLAAIGVRAYQSRAWLDNSRTFIPASVHHLLGKDVFDLLAEVHRLNAELVKAQRAAQATGDGSAAAQ